MDPIDFVAAVSGAARADLPPGLKLATIDPAYDAFATYPTVPLPKVTFDGETTLSTKRYPAMADYWPAAGDRVLMAPVGRSWLIVGPIRAATAVTRPYAVYQATANQATTSGAATFVLFDTAIASSGLVTTSVGAGGTIFTLGATGLWSVTATPRFAPQAGGVRETWLEISSNRLTANSQGGTSASHSTLPIVTTEWFNDGDGIAIGAIQNSGSTVNLEALASQALGRITLVYHGP